MRQQFAETAAARNLGSLIKVTDIISDTAIRRERRRRDRTGYINRQPLNTEPAIKTSFIDGTSKDRQTVKFYRYYLNFNVQKGVDFRNSKELTDETLVGRIIQHHYGGIIGSTGKKARVLKRKDFEVGVHNEKGIFAVWLPNGKMVVVKTGKREDIEREREGYLKLKKYRIGAFLPNLNYTHLDLLTGRRSGLNGLKKSIGLPEEMGYAVSDMILDYDSLRKLLKTPVEKGGLTPQEAVEFLIFYEELNAEMWFDPENAIHYNMFPDLNNPKFYSMQRKEWEYVKASGGQNLRQLAQTLEVAKALGQKRLSKKQLDHFKKARLRVKVYTSPDKSEWYWETRASYAEIEERLNLENRAPIAVVVAGDDDTSPKNLLLDKPFDQERKTKYKGSEWYLTRNIYKVDYEMLDDMVDYAEISAVMGKGKSPTYSLSEGSGLQGAVYNAELNTIDIDSAQIQYAQPALAIEYYMLNKLVPDRADEFGVDAAELQRQYMMRRVNSEFHTIVHLKQNLVKKHPLQVLDYLYEAGSWLKAHDEFDGDAKKVVPFDESVLSSVNEQEAKKIL